MSTHKNIDKICCGILALTILLTLAFVNVGKLGVVSAMAEAGYGSMLFDTSKVHTIDIVMEDWDSFLETCENEEYAACSVIIDNETFKNVGIRAKGNTSLSSVAAYGNNRYSFKVEFDCYEKGKNYHGLDKLSLNNIIQDNTYMKDYLAYRMMGDFGVAAPLCSYTYITVNGQDWGLYLAVEGVEESFLARNYGKNYGNLYKPDSMDMGGGRGNGKGFEQKDMEEFLENQDPHENWQEMGTPPEFYKEGGPGGQPESLTAPETEFMDNGKQGEFPFPGRMPGKDGGPDFDGPGGGPMGSDDVALIYSDDEYDSYRNIFENAKTDITKADKNRLIASLKTLGQGEDIESVVDVDAVVRYFVVHNFVCNFDSYTGSMIHNYYLYEKEGILSMIPWDYNLAFGGFEAQMDAEDMVNYPIDSPVSAGELASRPMIAWIFANEEYMEMYHRYFQEFIDSYFASGYFEEMIASVREMIGPYVEKDPTRFCTYEDFETGTDTLERFCLLRAESIVGQLNGTIPSTSEEQAKDKRSFVDASGILLSEMGSMGRGMMGKRKGG